MIPDIRVLFKVLLINTKETLRGTKITRIYIFSFGSLGQFGVRVL